MTRRTSPRLVTYTGIAAAGLLLALALGRAELVVVAAPFAVFATVGLALTRPPEIHVAFSLDADRIIEGEHVEALLEISTPSTIEGIDISVAIPPILDPEPPPHAFALHLSGGEARRFPFTLHARRWGVCEVGAVSLRALDSCGLFSYEGVAPCAVDLRVYPELERLRHAVSPLRTQPFPGSQTARANGEGIEFADIRRFQYGDQLRRVNWRASARRDELLVTESNPERTSDVVLLLDAYADVRHAGHGTLDAIVRAAASLAQAHLARRDRVGVVSFGIEVTWLLPATGERHLYQIIESLIETAVVRSYRWHNVSVLPPRMLPPNALVLALSPLTDQRTPSALLDLRARGFDVVVIAVSPVSLMPPPVDMASQLAHRLWLLSRDAVRFRFERLGVPVVEHEPGVSLSSAIEEVRSYRRFARAARG